MVVPWRRNDPRRGRPVSVGRVDEQGMLLRDGTADFDVR